MANPSFQLKDNLVILSTRNLLSGEQCIYMLKKDSITGIKVVTSTMYILGNFNDKVELQFTSQAGVGTFMTSFLTDVLGLRPAGPGGDPSNPGGGPGGPGGGGAGGGGGKPSGDPTRKNRRNRRS
jgi:hypothetical protein